MTNAKSQLISIEELIKLFINDRKEGKKELITWFLNNVMDQEAIEQLNADKYERNNKRTGYRNGYKKRKLKTLDGELILDKPDIRSGSFTTKVFDKYSTVEKALNSVIVESYINGISTRSVNSIISNLGINVSPEYVSSLNKDLDAKVKEFLETGIDDKIKYLYIDATYFKVRENSKYKSMALYTSIGVNSNGIRQLLSMDIYNSEDGMDWNNFFFKLKERGLTGVQLVISDGHKGIMNAVKESFPGSLWQYCHFHFLKNLRKTMGKEQWKNISKIVSEALMDESLFNIAIARIEEMNLDKSIDMFYKWYDSLYSYISFPGEHSRKLHTNNVTERFNRELKRRTRNIGAFPNSDSLMRLVVSIAMDINEEWLLRKYINMEVD
ncbi:MAG: IS256 family transposase [Ferroplasma sp.]|uniref:IS256 family transposase n=1 Tax=Ferroplasma sp. TaxID=2591003 RepID=UPI0028154A66|nr:IS256 family transposase [Ferroplasma sp.]WMT50443.1 MAG: IS256 family transposase [Ferroplasma sp.]